MDFFRGFEKQAALKKRSFLARGAFNLGKKLLTGVTKHPGKSLMGGLAAADIGSAASKASRQSAANKISNFGPYR
jgi:hypothetical protein